MQNHFSLMCPKSSETMTLTTWHCIRSPFNQICIFVGQKFLKTILKDFSHWNKCKYVLPYCGPSRAPGTIIWINMNLNYIRKFLCKYELFQLSGSRKDFKMIPPYFWISKMISPWKKKPGPSVEQSLILFTQGWFVPNLIEIEDCFQCKHM
jgi:hypothetical protein